MAQQEVREHFDHRLSLTGRGDQQVLKKFVTLVRGKRLVEIGDSPSRGELITSPPRGGQLEWAKTRTRGAIVAYNLARVFAESKASTVNLRATTTRGGLVPTVLTVHTSGRNCSQVRRRG